MKSKTLHFKLSLLALAAILILPGCTQVLVKDDTQKDSADTAHAVCFLYSAAHIHRLY